MMARKSKKAKTVTLWVVHSRRDGERVCGPFTKAVAERERNRLEGEQTERRADSPIRPLRIQTTQPGPVETDILIELARETGRIDLAARLERPARETASEVNVAEPPTRYELREVEELAGFDPYSEEPHDEQRIRLAQLEEADA